MYYLWDRIFARMEVISRCLAEGPDLNTALRHVDSTCRGQNALSVFDRQASSIDDTLRSVVGRVSDLCPEQCFVRARAKHFFTDVAQGGGQAGELLPVQRAIVERLQSPTWRTPAGDGAGEKRCRSQAADAEPECALVIIPDGVRAAVRLNDVVRIVGVSLPKPDGLSGEWGDDVLHGVVAASLEVFPSGADSVPAPSVVPDGQMRQRAIDMIFRSCGDELVAEYLLLHLCARVVVRSSTGSTGDVPLAIVTDGAHIFAPVLNAALTSGTILRTTELLRGPLGPVFDLETERLSSAPFHACRGHHITLIPDCDLPSSVDEALSDFIVRQTLEVDYRFQTVHLPADVSLLCLAESRPSTPGFVCVQHVSDTVRSLEPQERSFLRDYVSAVRCIQTSCLSEEPSCSHSTLLEAVQQSRSAAPHLFNNVATVHHNTINLRMSLSRAMASSFGRSSITLGDWAAVHQLEVRRYERSPHFF